MISEIQKKTGIPAKDISRILNALGDVIKETFSREPYVEIKLFPGLKVSSRYLLPEQSRSNLDIAKVDYILSLRAAFSDYFKKEVRALHSGR